MKRIVFSIVCLIMIISLCGCVNKNKFFKNEIEGNMKTYYEMKNGMWFYENNIYKYRLTIVGTIPNAETESTFVYLSNMKNISFEQAYKAAGISSDSNDYFKTKDAVLVEMR